MDGVQRNIANVHDRSADEVELSDTALAALAVPNLSAGTATEVSIYATDIAAGEGAETMFASEGSGDSVTFVNSFSLIEDFRSNSNNRSLVTERLHPKIRTASVEGSTLLDRESNRIDRTQWSDSVR